MNDELEAMPGQALTHNIENLCLHCAGYCNSKPETCTQMMLAAACDNEKASKILVEKGCDPLECTEDRFSALHYAGLTNSKKVTTYLLSRPGIVSYYNQCPQRLAPFIFSSQEMRAILLQAGINVPPLRITLPPGISPFMTFPDQDNAPDDEQEQNL